MGEQRSFAGWLIGNIGPAMFWGVWCFTGGWALAIYCGAIPVDSAGVRLVASLLGPASGAALAVMGALRVMQETGRRETRRAINRAFAVILPVYFTLKEILEAADSKAAMKTLVVQFGTLKAFMDISSSAAAMGDTIEAAGLHQRLTIALWSLEKTIGGWTQEMVEDLSPDQADQALENVRRIYRLIDRAYPDLRRTVQQYA